ncbi:helix-turn-helix transcriptional regulator [Microbulbifer bruguierae]|uniref:Helix-turn-helix transcriptional regulator n=1 Tax=Microbulbifer bruguierae TaxID=3029061 RepID=A0ABY8NBW4_9GAMM|nr:helix-turn-helix transcriptional regulator [Microbulbifer bruguierae]WGL15894.1 helix-turn-helix transcriptional regulator [Microbulbifer bruguierae]
MHPEFLQQMLPTFYKSAEQPGNWCQALDLIKNEMQLGSVVVQMLKRDGNRLNQQWVVRDSTSTEHAEAHDCLVNNADNPRLDLSHARMPMAESIVIRNECRSTAQVPSFKALRERMQMLGLGRPAILGVQLGEDRNLCMILHRRYDDTREFSEDQERFLHLLTPHLKQTVSLAEKIGRLEARTEFLSQSLDQFNTGVVVLDRQGGLHWSNHCARQIIQRSRHLSLSGKKLRCAANGDQRLFAELIDRAGRERGSRFVGSIGAAWDAPLQLLALPMPAADSAAAPYVALYLSESEVKLNLQAVDIVQLFGLTPAEAKLAIALCEGDSVTEYAAKLGVAVGTVRVQLKSIFSKLGVHRQPELVRIIGSSISAKTLHSLN